MQHKNYATELKRIRMGIVGAGTWGGNPRVDLC